MKGRRGPIISDEIFTTANRAKNRTRPRMIMSGMLVSWKRDETQNGEFGVMEMRGVMEIGRRRKEVINVINGILILICWFGWMARK